MNHCIDSNSTELIGHFFHDIKPQSSNFHAFENPLIYLCFLSFLCNPNKIKIDPSSQHFVQDEGHYWSNGQRPSFLRPLNTSAGVKHGHLPHCSWFEPQRPHWLLMRTSDISHWLWIWSSEPVVLPNLSPCHCLSHAAMTGADEPSHDKMNKWLCAQRRLRSAWASAQYDQSLCCVLNG